MRLILVFLLSLCFVQEPVAEAPSHHPFGVQDMLSMQRISDPQVSPQGTRIVFVLSTTDLKANRGRTDLWLIGADGSGLHRLTTHQASDFNPRWSPDGQRIWFLSTRSGSSQIWAISPAGGEAVQVSDLPLDAANLVAAPDGARLAFTMEVYPDCRTLECTTQRLEKKSAGTAYDSLFIRHWDTWKDGRRSHLFVIPSGGGKPVELTAGMKADVPSKPFGGPEEITFTPEAQALVFTSRDAGVSEPWSTNFDLFVVPADGSRTPQNLTASNKAWDTQPTFSPDGGTLAYLAMSRPGFESDRFRIVLMDWKSRTHRVLTEKWDRSPGGIGWAGDRTLLAVAANLGQRSLFALDRATGKVRTLVQNGTVGSFSPAGQRVVFGWDDMNSPVELRSVGLNGKDNVAITRINQERVSSASMGQAEQFTFEGWNGETVHAYVVKPIDFDPSRHYPVAFLIHGGPQGSFGNHFHYRWNPQVYAGHGYAAVMVDFHGSTGYGQAFTDAISGDWGGKPLIDLQKGLQAALDRYPWLDGDRVAALGASYGGYMINWIAGNWPQRFRCLVNHDGLFDLRSMYYSTEELWFVEWELGGPQWKNPGGYEKHNPVNFVKNWQAPMLVVHGGRDYRVPLEQGLGTFTALQRKGIPSRFLYYPGENHWVLKPRNSIQWHKEVLDWLDRWTK
ncbi:MAG: S9 family peptidase [Acidobacteriota bacterium]